MFKEVRQRKITIKIIEQIRTAILQGKLKPGDKLPSEKEMVALFQVSKQTLRESMRALEQLRGFSENQSAEREIEEQAPAPAPVRPVIPPSPGWWKRLTDWFRGL